MTASLGGRAANPIQLRVTCPHCWSVFPAEQALWVAQHPDLLGDVRLGSDQPQRFLPTRFTIEGAALDSRGFACHELACPKCHLSIPRALFEMESAFLSILGAPACGKSYFLASMTWQLRQVLPKQFSMSFGDADPLSNLRLHEYEALQFLNPDQDALVAIEKTETQGDLYNSVQFGNQTINYPRPFLFSLAPLEKHPNYHQASRISRALCLYDNAGESFLPGQDTATSPVTRHLALSRALLFLFDPTQDMRFRQACQGRTNDPQMAVRSERLQRERPVRQETILLEAAGRVRRYAGLAQQAKHSRPLVVVVTKYDSWSSLLEGKRLDPPWVLNSHGSYGMNLQKIEDLSHRLRELLWKYTPELVSAAEGFAQEVIYIPISATGAAPEVDPRTGAMGVRPRNMKPMWAEVPLLYTLSRWLPGVIPYVHSRTGGSSGVAAANGHGSAGLPSGPPLPPINRK